MKLFFTYFLLFMSFTGICQIQTPRISPSSELEQMVGLTEIEIDFNRPSTRGRDIFGNLVPYDKIWRTGANSGTEISFSTDVIIDGINVDSGSYTIYTIPNENSWELMLYSDIDQWSVPRDWDDSKVIFRSNFDVNKMSNGSALETFSIWIGNITNNDCHLNIGWADTYIKVKIEVPTRDLVEKSISATLSGPEVKASDYYSAAVYYREENIKLNQALKWMEKFIEMTKEPRFFHLRQYALILAGNKDYQGAVNASRRSLRLSIQANNEDYVKMNNESIEEWSKKIR
ncbi:MAG: DUF2911 domain-containing protein [Flammeovirgaceae bacterium TMED290]|nr:MAG: DUF2911 domain-containing protein [Flammeovirgaceae bacterium TMED290]